MASCESSILRMSFKQTLLLGIVAGANVWHIACGTSFAQNGDQDSQSKLAIQFSDDFSGELNPQHWITRQGKYKTQDGYLRMDATRPPPAGPGGAVFSILDLKEKCFSPGLTGTNGVEVTLDPWGYDKDYPKELDAKIHPTDHRMAWAMTIGSWRGQLGQNDEQDRGLQLHFDWMGRYGLYMSFSRSILPEDLKTYPDDDIWRLLDKGKEGADEFRTKQDKLIEDGVFISAPCLVMACRIYRPGWKFVGERYRFGLYLADDARTAYWTLDGKKMDSFDLGDYFHSSPEVSKDGLYLTIVGFGIYQNNVFDMDDVTILTSKNSAE